MSLDLLLEKLFKLESSDRETALYLLDQCIDDFVFSGKAIKSKSKSGPKKKTGKYEAVTEASLNPEDKVILAKLKAWRNQVAKDLEIQPFIVFNNETLINMAFYKPKTEEELLKIKGIGSDKTSKFGETILEIIGGETSLQETTVEPEMPKRRFLKSNK